MIQKIILYAALVAIPIAAWLGYDYGAAKEKDRSQRAAQSLTERSTKIADAGEKEKEKIKIVYRDLVRTVELAHENTECLDAGPGSVIADSVRRLQSRPR